MTSLRVFNALTCALAIAAASVALSSANGPNRLSAEQRRAQAAALRTGDLRGAAAIGGFVVDRFSMPEGVVQSFDWLVSKSQHVLVGVIRQGRSTLAANARTITTNYLISVEDVLKGSATPGSAINVNLIGGRVRFGRDWAETRVTGVLPPVRDQRFLMFLKHDAKADESIRFANTSGPIVTLTELSSSLFEIKRDGTVAVHGRYAGAAKRIEGKPLADALSIIAGEHGNTVSLGAR